MPLVPYPTPKLGTTTPQNQIEAVRLEGMRVLNLKLNVVYLGLLGPWTTMNSGPCKHIQALIYTYSTDMNNN